MMHRDDAVVLGWIAIPSRAVIKIGPKERPDLANGIINDGFRKDVSYHHVAFRMESLAIRAFDPFSGWQTRRLAQHVPLGLSANDSTSTLAFTRSRQASN